MARATASAQSRTTTATATGTSTFLRPLLAVSSHSRARSLHARENLSSSLTAHALSRALSLSRLCGRRKRLARARGQEEARLCAHKRQGGGDRGSRVRARGGEKIVQEVERPQGEQRCVLLSARTANARKNANVLYLNATLPCLFHARFSFAATTCVHLNENGTRDCKCSKSDDDCDCDGHEHFSASSSGGAFSLHAQQTLMCYI